MEMIQAYQDQLLLLSLLQAEEKVEVNGDLKPLAETEVLAEVIKEKVTKVAILQLKDMMEALDPEEGAVVHHK
jgi:hypothetical protein